MFSESESKKQVIVVGGGVAGVSAALAAAELGVDVLLLEKAPLTERGGDSRFSGGVLRVAHKGSAALYPYVGAQVMGADVGEYSPEQFSNELVNLAEGDCDAPLIRRLAEETAGLAAGLSGNGVPLTWNYGTEGTKSVLAKSAVALKASALLAVSGGGEALMESLYSAVVGNSKISVQYGFEVDDLILREGKVIGVEGVQDSNRVQLFGPVVLASGGFQMSKALTGIHFGGEWEKIRRLGSPYNDGKPLTAAINANAKPSPNWHGAHVTPVSVTAPAVGDLRYHDDYVRFSYIYSVMVNLHGRRFVDEASDHYRSTYTQIASAILRQPAQCAYQVFDAQTEVFKDPRYANADYVTAGSLEELAVRCGLPVSSFLDEVQRYNESTGTGFFDPFSNDGLSTSPGLIPPKSNWALPITKPPFTAYLVTGALVFTFGGLATDLNCQVISNEDDLIEGLFASGELLGGLYNKKFPGGAGLSFAWASGRIAGKGAALLVGRRE